MASHQPGNLSERFNRAFYASPLPKTVSSIYSNYQLNSASATTSNPITNTQNPSIGTVGLRSITPPSDSAGSKRKLDDTSANTQNDGNATKKVTTMGEFSKSVLWDQGRIGGGGHAPLPITAGRSNLGREQTYPRHSEPSTVHANGRGSSLRQSFTFTSPKRVEERQPSIHEVEYLLEEEGWGSDGPDGKERDKDDRDTAEHNHDKEMDHSDNDESPSKPSTKRKSATTNTAKLDTLLSSPEKRKLERVGGPTTGKQKIPAKPAKPAGPPKVIAEIQSKVASKAQTASAKSPEKPQPTYEKNTRRARESTRGGMQIGPDVSRSEQINMGPPKTPAARPSRAASQVSVASSRASSTLGPRIAPDLGFGKRREIPEIPETPLGEPKDASTPMPISTLLPDQIPSPPPAKRANRRRSQRESSVHEETVPASVSTPAPSMRDSFNRTRNEIPETPYETQPIAHKPKPKYTPFPTRKLPTRAARKEKEIPETPFTPATTTTTVKEKLGLDDVNVFNTPEPEPDSSSPSPEELDLIPEKERRRYSASAVVDKQDSSFTKSKSKKAVAAKSKKPARKSMPSLPATVQTIKKRADAKIKAIEAAKKNGETEVNTKIKAIEAAKSGETKARRHSSYTSLAPSSSSRRTRRSAGPAEIIMMVWGGDAVKVDSDHEMEDAEEREKAPVVNKGKGREKAAQKSATSVSRSRSKSTTTSTTSKATAKPSPPKSKPTTSTSTSTKSDSEPSSTSKPPAPKSKPKPKPKAKDTTQIKSVIMDSGKVVKVSSTSGTRPSRRKRTEYDFSDEEE